LVRDSSAYAARMSEGGSAAPIVAKKYIGIEQTVHRVAHWLAISVLKTSMPI